MHLDNPYMIEAAIKDTISQLKTMISEQTELIRSLRLVIDKNPDTRKSFRTWTPLANWIIYCSQSYFQPMYNYFHRELLKHNFAIADETRTHVLKKTILSAVEQSFMWLFHSREDGLLAIILYDYSPTMSGRNTKEFLNGYQGYNILQYRKFYI